MDRNGIRDISTKQFFHSISRPVSEKFTLVKVTKTRALVLPFYA